MPTTCDESEHGDAEFRALFEEIYSELHAIAERHARRNRPDHTLQATALVHEAYVKLSQRPRRVYRDLIHFRATAARAIRHILVNHEKARRTKKRGGGMQRIALDERVVGSSETDLDLLALDDALSQLAEIDDRQCRVVELRYFGGLTVSEIAAELERPLGRSKGTGRRRAHGCPGDSVRNRDDNRLDTREAHLPRSAGSRSRCARRVSA